MLLNLQQMTPLISIPNMASQQHQQLNTLSKSQVPIRSAAVSEKSHAIRQHVAASSNEVRIFSDKFQQQNKLHYFLVDE